MLRHKITPDTTVFAVLSFEGPDAYARAGGLSSRVTELTQALATKGYQTHLYFVGDPEHSTHEERRDGRLHLWRVAQAVSNRFPIGVYAGENEKHEQYVDAVPHLLLRNVVEPAVADDKRVVVMGEDWHTAQTVSAVSDLLYWQGLRREAVLLWNANNTYGFDNIDWRRLTMTAQVTAVSRYMKHRLRERNVSSLVIPNGIPARHLEPVDTDLADALRRAVGGERLLLTKVARFDPDKNWIPAIHAVARLKSLGLQPLLLMRGGIEPHGKDARHEIDRFGLRRWDLQMVDPTPERIVTIIDEVADSVDVIDFRFYVPEEVQRAVFHASDAVLANSRHEPFGLVGLEVMAAGGLAFTGSTGEDYAQHLLNAVTLDTDDPNEIVGSLLFLQEHRSLRRNVCRLGRLTARLYTWDNVLKKLESKILHLIMDDTPKLS